MIVRLFANGLMFAALLGACWWIWTSPIPPLLPLAVNQATVTEFVEPFLAETSTTQADTVWQKSLFHFEPEVVALVAPAETVPVLPQPVAVPPFKLLGLIETEEGRVALLDRGDGSKPVRVRESTMIDAWVVDGMSRRAILVRRGEETLRLEIGRVAVSMETANLAADDIGRIVPPPRIIQIPLPPAPGASEN